MLTWLEFTNVSTGRPVFLQAVKVTCVMAVDSTTTRVDFDGGSCIVVAERYDFVVQKLGIETNASEKPSVKMNGHPIDHDALEEVVNNKTIRAACVEKAIELGEASPPVHCIRKDYGIVRYGSQISLLPGPPSMPNHEHWRGQSK